MDFNLPADLVAYLGELDRFIAAEIAPLQAADDSGSTAMSCGARLLDKAARAGISATHGAHQVAQKLITMPRPRKSAIRCSLPPASRNTASGGSIAGLVGTSLAARSANPYARGLRGTSPADRVPPTARTIRRDIELMLKAPP